MFQEYPKSFYNKTSNKRLEELPYILGKKQPKLKSKDKGLSHISTLFSQASPELVCGPDERIKQNGLEFPNRMICRLIILTQDNQEYIATGFFISPKCVITSGHCVYPNGEWAKSITVIPGDNGTSSRKPFGFAKSTDFRCVEGWTKMKSRDFDYGAIILPDQKLYNAVGSFFQTMVIHEVLNVSCCGYTNEKSKEYEQWGRSGMLSMVSVHRLYYNIDTETGNSGSPVFMDTGTEHSVVGIHSYGFCPNYAVRIDEKITEVFASWK